METTRQGTTIIYENGEPVEINTNFVDALIKANPAKYSKTAPGKGKPELPGKENLKVEKTAEKPEKVETDGKFTVDDLLQLGYKELQDMAKKLNAKGASIKVSAKKPELAQALFDESQK